MARDIERIEPLMNRLEAVWKKYPNLRLGQLILNVVRDPALYYKNDTELITAIENFYGVLEKYE